MSSPPAPAAPRFSYAKIAAIGSGFFGITLVWSVYNAYLPLLLAGFVESRALRGAIMGLDNLLALLLLPLIGAWSDRVDGRLGRRLPFVVAGMPVAALAFAALPAASVALPLLLAVDIAFLLAMTVFRAPVIALMPDHTPKAKRSSANGVINLMGGIGGVLAFVALGPLWDLGRAWPFVLAAGLLLVAFAVLVASVDRHPSYVSAGEGDERAPLAGLLRDLRALTAPSRRGPRWILAAIALYFLGFAGLEAQFTTYATETLGVSGGRAGLMLGGFSVAFVAAALPAGFLGNRLGKGRTMLLGLALLTPLFVGLAWLPAGTALVAALVAAGACWALVNVQAYPLVADFGDGDRIGFYTGMYYLFSMAASIVAPALSGLAMDLVGGKALFGAAALWFLLGGLALTRGMRALASRPEGLAFPPE